MRPATFCIAGEEPWPPGKRRTGCWGLLWWRVVTDRSWPRFSIRKITVWGGGCTQSCVRFTNQNSESECICHALASDSCKSNTISPICPQIQSQKEGRLVETKLRFGFILRFGKSNSAQVNGAGPQLRGFSHWVTRGNLLRWLQNFSHWVQY